MITIAICTYNRSDILPFCLESVLNQTRPSSVYEILVINNASTDKTEKILERFQSEFSNIRVLNELKIGLSYARNRAVLESKYDWVAFIDDDAKAHPNFVEVALDTIQNYDFDCFGGFYNAWYRNPPPPNWLPEDFGTNRSWLPNTLGELAPGFEFSGGVCAYKKQVVIEAGLFPTFLGMQGDKIGYGEENYVQRKIRELGYKIGFNPNLQIDHEVREEKLKIRWHLSRSFAIKRDHAILNKKHLSLQDTASLFRVESVQLIKRIFKHGKAFLNRKKSFNGFILEVFIPTFSLWGQIAGSIKSAQFTCKKR